MAKGTAHESVHVQLTSWKTAATLDTRQEGSYINPHTFSEVSQPQSGQSDVFVMTEAGEKERTAY